ncbi:hypothetical protein MBLNU459_g3020t1 [Dothideomycetes sp. NU459]
MTTPSKPATPAAGAGRRPSIQPPKPQSTPSRSPSRLSAQTPPASTPGGPARTRSVRGGASVPLSARASVKKPAAASQSSRTTNTAADTDAEDAKAEAAAALEELREQLQQAELAAEEQQKQAAVLQARLDDATKEQSKLEETVHEQQESMEELENEKKESVRMRRELEAIYEAERASAMKDKEESQGREDELRDVVQRLKEAVANKELRVDDERRPSLSRASSFRSNASPNPEGGHFAPPSSLQRSDSRSSSRLVLQKDKIIESLRLELAEAQIKLVEMENMGGGRMQELEKTLMETRMANARLMEDNESFQLLLSEKTLNGDFGHSGLLRAPSSVGSRPSSRDLPSSSLADELDSAVDDENIDHRRLQAEVNSLKDQNKALSLYVNNIISRLLQHKEFENILDKTPNLMSGTPAPATDANVDKELPPPPPEKDEAPTSFLQRATSVVRRAPRPTPQGQHSESSLAPATAVNEDPATAPRIPLARPQTTRVTSGGHRRSQSEWNQTALVNSMYRGTSPASGQTSPGLPPPRGSSLFSPASLNANPAAVARMPSSSSVPRAADHDRAGDGMPPPPPHSASNRDSKSDSGRNSILSDSENANPASPPRSITSNSDKPSGAIMGGNKMRPLRLVQEAAEQDEAAKKANRSSWMGWFNKGAAGGRAVSGDGVPRE